MRKILALLFTCLVIGLLTLSGPVEGVSLSLSINKEKPKQGDTITVTANIEIAQNENTPIKRIVFELDGPQKVSCAFDREGSPLSGCKNIRITLLNQPLFGYGYDSTYGYGYGFSPGNLQYKIEIDTDDLKAGTYSTMLKVEVNHTYIQYGKNFTVKKDASGKVCAPEWSCTSWSACSAGVQTRECYRNLNACEIEEKPKEQRLCLAQDGEFLTEESILLNSIAPQTLSSSREPSIKLSGFSSSIHFIIILLLMNCIITTMNLIIKVQQNRHKKIRRLPKMPIPPKQNLR